MTQTIFSMSPRRSSPKYTDPDELKRVVREHARAEWRALTGAEWCERRARDFANPDIRAHEQEAIEVCELLISALKRAAEFHRDHKGKTAQYGGRTTMTHGLINFIELHLPMLVNCATRSSDGAPAICNIIERQPDGWLVETRGRVATLMTDRLRYWQHFGLRAAATNRQMAYATLILGCYPTVPLRTIRTKGMTVAQVLKFETAAVRAAKSRVDRADREWRRRSAAGGR